MRRAGGVGRLAARGDASDDRRRKRGRLVEVDDRRAQCGEPNVRLMPRTQAFGYYAQNFLALGEIVSDAERKAERRRAARATVAGARQRGGARLRRDRAAAGVPRQRPAGRDARRRGAHLPQPLRRQSRRARRRRDRARQRLSRRARSRGGGGKNCSASSICAREAVGSTGPRRRARAGLEIMTGVKLVGDAGQEAGERGRRRDARRASNGSPATRC